MHISKLKLALTAVVGVSAMMTLAACAPGSSTANAVDAGADTSKVAELRLGYFANITHAPALIGVKEGLFQKALGDTKVTTSVFNAGPAVIEALSAGALDAAYIGPSPAINSYVKSAGQSLVVVAGATNGGAQLVVKPEITSVDQLKGKTIATPQLGNTQDVALRSFLADKGFKTDVSGGGDVKITPTDNAQTLTLFQQGQLDGAWLPEPWASRLVVDAGAKVLVDEASLWPNGSFPTTELVVSKKFFDAHPATVKKLLQGHLDALDAIANDPAHAAEDINAQLKVDAGKPLSPAVLERALKNVQFSADPNAATYADLLKHAVAAGTAKTGKLDGIFNLQLVNELLKARGGKPVLAGGLGTE
ncbi:MAG TPA: ABC transporter substrate-binding protein [Candidatus Lumbricidophila sp.]|nr:ABC transporter substrate-binding protein [Candidatus Lumbricidophila sp.]